MKLSCKQTLGRAECPAPGEGILGGVPARPYRVDWVEGLLVTQSSGMPPAAVLTPARASVLLISFGNSAPSYLLARAGRVRL